MADSDMKKRKKKKSMRTYITFLRRIAKSINPDLSFSVEALRELHDVLNFSLTELTDTSNVVSKLYAKQLQATAKPKLLKLALRLCMRGDLRDRVISKGEETLLAFVEDKNPSVKKKKALGAEGGKGGEDGDESAVAAVA
tara:strand:- start:924 stop:1343 length:420 start_codon:yes stop_codon:yes gene_type:complete